MILHASGGKAKRHPDAHPYARNNSVKTAGVLTYSKSIYSTPAASISVISITRLDSTLSFAFTPSSSIVMQNGQATPIVLAPVCSASSVRSTLTRLPICSSSHILPPPAPQQNEFSPVRFISTRSPNRLISIRDGS